MKDLRTAKVNVMQTAKQVLTKSKSREDVLLEFKSVSITQFFIGS